MQPTDPKNVSTEDLAANRTAPSRQEIFEQTWNELMNGFGEQCEKHNIDCSIAIAKSGEFDEPFIFYRASHIIEAAYLMAKVLRQIKNDVYAELNTEKPIQ
jgi:glutamine amidotransferase PdxT